MADAISPPFRPQTREEEEETVERLNRARPDLIWVGLGAPKQEIWMSRFCGRVPGVMVGVGAAFDFHAGVVPQAPARLQRMGLEWAYRLLKEPRRLFLRYLRANPTYLVLVFAQWLFGGAGRREYQVHLDQDHGVFPKRAA